MMFERTKANPSSSRCSLHQPTTPATATNRLHSRSRILAHCARYPPQPGRSVTIEYTLYTGGFDGTDCRARRRSRRAGAASEPRAALHPSPLLVVPNNYFFNHNVTKADRIGPPKLGRDDRSFCVCVCVCACVCIDVSGVETVLLRRTNHVVSASRARRAGSFACLGGWLRSFSWPCVVA